MLRGCNFRRVVLRSFLLTATAIAALRYLTHVLQRDTSSWSRTLATTSHLMTPNLMDDDPSLVEAVREALVPPPSGAVPYNLENHHRKYFSEDKQDIIVEEILKGKVGAYTGEESSNSLYFERELGWKGVLIEPAPASFLTLLSKNRRAYLLNACLSPTNASTIANFKYSVAMPQLSKVLETEEKNVTVPVWCVPIYSVLLAFGNPVVDYFSLDVESLDLQVLHTIPWDKVNIRVFSIEVTWNPKHLIMKYMRSRGYILYQSKRNTRQIDVIFYRPDLV